MKKTAYPLPRTTKRPARKCGDAEWFSPKGAPQGHGRKSVVRGLPVKGFTLIEFTIGLAIVALLFGLATPYLFGTKEKSLLEAERDKIVSNLKIAQQKAIETYQGYDHGFQFDQATSPHQYLPVVTDLTDEIPIIQPAGQPTILDSQIKIGFLDKEAIIFQRLTGRPETPFNLTLHSKRFKVEIHVSEAGVITSTNPEKL